MAIFTLHNLQVVVDEHLPGWKVDSIPLERRIVIKHPTLPGVLSLDYNWLRFKEDEEIIQRLKGFKEENPHLFQSGPLGDLLMGNQFVGAAKDSSDYPKDPQEGTVVFDTTNNHLKIFDSQE